MSPPKKGRPVCVAAERAQTEKSLSSKIDIPTATRKRVLEVGNGS